MTKKIINTDAITNELEGASLFFSKPESQTKKKNPEKESPTPPSQDKEKLQAYSVENQDQKRPNVRTNEPPNERTDIFDFQKPAVRRKIRHTFDIFEDQLHSLLLVQYKAVQKGRRKPKLGKMVQDAIDLFLEQKAKKMKRG